MKPRALLLPFLLLFAVPLAAQAYPRASLSPSPLENGARMQSGTSRPTKGCGRRVGPKGAVGAAESYWYWNRGSYLPAPSGRRFAGAAPVAAAGTRVVSNPHGWLLAAARSSEVSWRSRAIYALGCAGPAAHGLPLLLRALDDESSEVRQSALLALGEHAGTGARFRLVRAINAAERSDEFRRIAALAYGIACAVDGGEGGRALRRFAAIEDELDCRAAACAADRLTGGNPLCGEAAEWLLAFREARGDQLPGLAVGVAVAGMPRDRVVANLKSVLTSSAAHLRLAARGGALAHGHVSLATLRKWIAVPSNDECALAMLAAVAHTGFPALANKGFESATLRGVAALGLAIHARQMDHPTAREELLAASRNQRSFAERPLWLLALAMSGDSATPARAQALLQDARSPEAMRLAAADAIALTAGADRSALRRAVHLDPSPAVRLRAADGVARHGNSADARTLGHAVEHAGDDDERRGVLVALGRIRQPGVGAILRRWCSDPEAGERVRDGAFRGLALQLRHSGPAPISRLPRGVAFGYLPGWLLELVDRQR